MLRIEEFALETLRRLGPVVAGVSRRDPDLARQMRRAAASMVLNLAEAQAARDGNARARFRTALGSTRETRAALRVAAAWGYAAEDASLLDALDRIAATLHKLGR